MSLNAALDMLFNIFLCLSISFSSPTFARSIVLAACDFDCSYTYIFSYISIGTLTVMPVSVVVDDFVKHKLAVPLVYIGKNIII